MKGINADEHLYPADVFFEHENRVCFSAEPGNREQEDIMLATVSVPEHLVREAGIFAEADRCSVTEQIEHWIRIGKCAQENPDLTYDLITEILVGIEELEQGECSEYKFG